MTIACVCEQTQELKRRILLIVRWTDVERYLLSVANNVYSCLEDT